MDLNLVLGRPQILFLKADYTSNDLSISFNLSSFLDCFMSSQATTHFHLGGTSVTALISKTTTLVFCVHTHCCHSVATLFATFPDLTVSSSSLFNIPSQVTFGVQLELGEAVAHELEPVVGPVGEVKVFDAQLAAADDALVQHPTAREEGRHPPVGGPLLVPTLAGGGPHQRLVDLVRVPHVLVDDGRVGDETFDVLLGHLPDPPDKVVAVPVHPFQQGTVAGERIGSQHRKVVGHVLGRHGKIRLRFLRPGFDQIDPVASDGRVVGAKRDVESGRADH